MKKAAAIGKNVHLHENCALKKELCRKKYMYIYSIDCHEIQQKREISGIIGSHISEKKIFSNLMLEWLDSISLTVKLSTYQKYECLIRNHIIGSTLGNMFLYLINSNNINDFAAELLKKLSAKSVNDILVIINLGLTYAEETYNIPKPKIRFVKGPAKDIRVLSVSEQKILECYLRKDMDICKFGVLLALYTGIRVGELCALQWEDIRSDGIVISKTMHRIKSGSGTILEITEPKTKKSNRIIPLPEFLADDMELFRDVGPVVRLSNGKAIEPRLMQHKFEMYIKDCGLPHTNFHALRHTFATRCVEAGFDIKSLSEILGHTDVRTTLNKYVHSSMEQKKKNMALLCPATEL